MKLTETKPTEKSSKKLKLSIFNIKSLLVFNRKKLDKIKKEKKKFSLFQMKKKKVEEKENKIESPRTVGSTLKNIGKGLLAKPLSIIDKLKEFFGIILLGVLVNNLPTIVKKLQDVLGQIKKFFEDNPWIGKVITFTFDIIAKGMMGILDLTKVLMPVIGGSFKFALDTIKTAGKEIGKAITLFDQLDAGISSVMSAFGYKPPAKAAQTYAKSKGKYYSNTTGKTYANYKSALKDPKVKQGAQQQATQKSKKIRQVPTASGGSYNPNTGYTYNPNFKDPAQAVGVLAPKAGVMGTMIPGQKDTWREYGPGENKNIYKQNVQRYSTVNQAQKVQKLAIGGTVRNFFGNMFGSRRGLGNIPPQEGTGRGGPSDIRMATKDSGKTYASPYASPGGTAKGRKARETVNYFKFFENNVKNEERNLVGEEKNLTMFSEFMKSYSNLLDIRKKYRDTDSETRRNRNAQTESPDDYDPGEVGSFASGAYIGPPGDADGEQTGLNMNLPGGIGTPIYAPRDLIYKKKGTNGGPSVGLQGTPDALGPSGSGFGFYGSYFFKENDKEYEVLMGHFKDMPYKGSSDGEIIKKGTLLGYQGASGRSVSSSNGVYPHISLHLNGVGFQASNQELVKFANSLRASGGTKAVSSSKPSASASGLASFYGGPFDKYWHGRKTASGQVFDENAFSAALKDGLPFGMYEVAYKNKTVLVRGNDRGNFGPGNTAGINPPKDFDLSYGAAKALGITSDGRGGVGRITYKRVGDLKPTGGGIITKPKPPKPSTQASPQAKMDAQSLRTNISNLMGDLGVTKKIFGQQNLSVEIKDGKLEIKDTRGVFGTGLFQSNYDTKGSNLKLLKDIENYLKYELNKKREEQNKPGAGASGYGGASASIKNVDDTDKKDLVIVKETLVAVVESPPEVITNTVNNYVPILISQGTSASRSLRSTLS
jgi:rare lipoprotein A (peptidoglycan hydrolase)